MFTAQIVHTQFHMLLHESHLRTAQWQIDSSFLLSVDAFEEIFQQWKIKAIVYTNVE